MPSGLVALLDDVVSLTKVAAASLDDVSAAAGKAGVKAAGVVVDDTAVTPRYVIGFTPDRELPIIVKIAKGSLRNKLLFILPAAMALSALAPWAITPLLMLGGAYLCFEATEKLAEAVFGHHAHAEEAAVTVDAATFEQEKVSGAIRTDFILSAEIMAIALADVADRPLPIQGAVLIFVAIAITIAVYGVVGLIVKMDDIGLHLAARRQGLPRHIGRGLVRGMPVLMRLLEVIGTAAMLWVGGGIIIHGLEESRFSALPHSLHTGAEAVGHLLPLAEGALIWVVGALGSALAGVIVGGIIVAAVSAWKKARGAHG
jgi:predicted DNA repair protein MutK